MMRLCSALVFLAAAAAPARAHFIWILPGDGNSVRLVFSDSLQPDDPALLKKIAHAQLTVRSADGKTATLRAKAGKDALEAMVPGTGVQEVAAVCHYGAVQHGKAEPFLLHYYAKGFTGLHLGTPPTDLPQALASTWDMLPLEIVPLPGEGASVRVFWHGKPLAGAEYVLLAPDLAKPAEGKTDTDGKILLGKAHKPGLCGIRVRHTEIKEGQLAGKAYKEVRHYATLTLVLGDGAATRSESNPEATRLLADARAARALYAPFPGFTADVEVNIDGKVTRGPLAVSPKGKVQLELGAASNDEAQRWAKGLLTSIITHRLDSGVPDETPCTFADDDTDNPLGRAIRVATDEFHSSYRIRDRQILVVNRQMKDARFTITVLENRLTEDKKFLPVSYVVNTWDLKTDALRSAEAHHQSWQRVGGLDLPRTALVVTATAGKQQARSLTLSNWKLAQ